MQPVVTATGSMLDEKTYTTVLDKYGNNVKVLPEPHPLPHLTVFFLIFFIATKTVFLQSRFFPFGTFEMSLWTEEHSVTQSKGVEPTGYRCDTLSPGAHDHQSGRQEVNNAEPHQEITGPRKDEKKVHKDKSKVHQKFHTGA